jgi:hypothetical protein
MTQLTWDKQHYTHNSAGKHSIAAPVGRTAGGGIRFGEMESHACEASGLIRPHSEIRSKMDNIDIPICMKCETLPQQCRCGNSDSMVTASMPHSMTVFSHANLLTAGFIMKFKLGF